MSDAIPVASKTPVGTTPGALLRSARELAGLSIERVAKDLFLDIAKIKSIEADRFQDIGAPVYAKGYLRKFARLVNVSEDEILRHYAALSDAPIAADPVPVTVGLMPEPRKPLPRWMLWGVIALIGVAIVITLLNLRTTPTNTHTERVSTPLALSMQSSSQAAAPVAAGVATASSAVAASNDVSVRLKFNGDSWVEIYDARDQQVFYDMGVTNAVRDVTGKPPLRVVLGAASAVNLQVNAQDVVIPSSHIQAGVARFVINAQGELQ